MLLIVFYLTTRFINLTLLPVFNDEAIYIDWGQKMLGGGGFFFSLFDGKQPFLMWIFGVFANIFPDPLFGGRFVSVIFGLFTLLGIYKIGSIFFEKRTAFLASLIYILSPLFLFYDRQALMESAVSAIGVWIFYFGVQFAKLKDLRTAIYLGLLFGIGFFIKTNIIAFFFSFLILYFIFERKLNRIFFLIFVTSFLILIPLFFQKDFLKIFELNSRFSFTFSELFRFPVGSWLINLVSVLNIALFQTFGLLLIFALIPFRTIKKNKELKIIFLWTGVLLVFYILTVRTSNPRYLVSFLPLLTIPIAKGLFSLEFKFRTLIFVVFLLPFIFLNIEQIFNTSNYFDTLSRFTKYSQKNVYMEGFTSGFMVKEAADYVADELGGNKGIVGVRLDAGNPENSVSMYLSKKENIKRVFLDSKIVSLPQNQNYINSNVPIYFISRDEHLAGLEKFFILKKKFIKPDGISSIGVYQLRTKGN